MKTTKIAYGIALALTWGLATSLKAQNLYVADFNNATVGEYTTSGATVNASLITKLDGAVGVAISGTNLFVLSQAGGTVGEYTTSGATINASLTSGLYGSCGIAILLAPQLNIATVGNQSVLFYPTWATGYVLQNVTNRASTNWLTVTDSVPVIAVTVTNNLPARFFRLAPAN